MKAVTQVKVRDLGRIKIGRLGAESAEERNGGERQILGT